MLNTMASTPINARRQEALVKLMDDETPVVRAAVMKEIRRHGSAGMDLLRQVVSRNEEPAATLARDWLREFGEINGAEAFLDFIGSYRYELETGCLLLDKTVFPQLDTREYYTFMNEAASRCRELMLMPASGYEITRVINRVLFHEYGFRGDSDNYYNPLNSYLHQVVKRRRGIPITLSILYILLADRCGLTLEPIALPGHFMVGCFSDDEPFYIDVFARGSVRTQDDVEVFLMEHHIQPRAEHFRPAPVGDILARCCRNLANQYAREQDEQRVRFFKNFVRAFEEAYRNHAEH